MIKCSLCNQTFDEEDEDIEYRKQRHELGMHSRDRTIYSERDGSPSKPMGNHTYGTVAWTRIKQLYCPRCKTVTDYAIYDGRKHFSRECMICDNYVRGKKLKE